MHMKIIKEYARDINFAHLYFGELRLTKILNFKGLFNSYREFDLENGSFNENRYELIFIEIEQLNKKNFKILNETIGHNIDKNILVFASDYKNTILSKFLVYSSINQALPLKNEEEEIKKSFYDFLTKAAERKHKSQQLEISKKINSLFSFLLFKEDKLTFANENAKIFFELDELPLLQDKIYNIKNIKNLLKSNMDSNIIYKKNYTIYINNFLEKKEKLLTIVQNSKQTQEATNPTTDRFSFIETLKDEIAQNSIDKKPILLFFFNIINYDKLKNANTHLAIYNLTKKILETLLQIKDSNEKIIYWDEHFFILYTKEKDFEIAKIALEKLHDMLIHLDNKENFLPSITSSALDIGSLELNEAIKCIESISLKSFDKKKFEIDSFYELNNLNACLSESDQIKYLLNNYLNRKSPIKLLNIYKGLCINTESKILKIQDDSYFVHCENLQTYSMKFENKTVIQAPELPKDIQAYISYINTEKSYAILGKLTFLSTSANNRQYTRVQPRIRMPITIKYEKSILQGEVFDISTKAIAIILNQIIKEEYYLHKTVKLTFKLSNSSNEDGFDLMDIEAKVVNIIENEESKSKLITMLDLQQPYDSYLLKYMYDRQKELIIELKRASKL